MNGKNAKKFEQYYKRGDVVRTYDSQREANKHRRDNREKEAKVYLKFLEKEKNDKILEIGCGSGYLTQYLGNITAIDTSTGLLEIAKKKCLDAKFLEASVLKLPFKDHEFDKATTHRVIGNFNEDEYRIAIREIGRVLKKDGIFVFDMGDPIYIRHLFRKTVSLVYKIIYSVTGFGKNEFYSLKKIGKILNSNGFKIEQIAYIKKRFGKGMILKARKIN